MPQILVNGQLKEVTQAEFDAWTAANPGAGEAAAGGDVLQVTAQPEILIPNTSNTSPEQDLEKIYQEFEVEPPPVSGADYYGEELNKDIKNRAYDIPTTLDPVASNAEYLAKLAQEEAERAPIIAALSQPVTSGLYTVDPLTKDIANRVYDIPTTLPLTKSNQTLYGSANLATSPIQISKPPAGDTLSGGGAAALIGAATIGAYAYRALFPPNVNDYSKLTEYYKVDGLPPITPEHYGPSDAKNYGEYYNQDGLPPIEPENYDAISLDNPYEDQIGLENLTDDTISYNDLVDQDVDPNAPQNINIPGGGFYGEPPPTSPNYTSVYNPETGTYDVIDIDTGQIADTGLDQESAELAALTANSIGDPAYGTEPDAEVADSDVVTEPFVDNVTSTSEEVTVSDAELFGDSSTTLPEYVTSYNPETGNYDIIDKNTGSVAASGLTEQEAMLGAENLSAGGEMSSDAFVDDGTGFNVLAEEANPVTDDPQWVETSDGFSELEEDIAAREESEALLDAETVTDDPQWAETSDGYYELEEDIAAREEAEARLDAETVSLDDPLASYGAGADDERVNYEDQAAKAAAEQQAAKANLQAQATIQKQRNQASQGDWRVRLRLAPNANYLYKAVDAGSGILGPLVGTDGVIFPYMPQIQTTYHAGYDSYDLTHSNYRGYFYKSSYVGEVNITAPFTAQDTYEAQYLLAVIHFFRTVTKMFYGQDSVGRGSPPPLVYLQGLGEYQFNLHPCVISQFTYNLPNDVDYIRAGSPNFDGTNMLARRSNKQATASNPVSSAMNRLRTAGLPVDGEPIPPPPETLGIGGRDSTNAYNNPTYVPTKMDIQLTLLPIQSRDQVSTKFSMQKFANGNLLRGGFW